MELRATDTKPLIGVSAGFHGFGDYAGVGYQRSLVMAGAVPMLFSRVPGGLDDQLDRVDGVMLAAGHDIDPARYGQEPHPLLGTLDHARDGFDIELVQRAVDRGLPIIGTCRGMQMLNVALGGTMVQDLSLVEAWRAHPSDPTGRYWRRFAEATMAGMPAPDHPRHPIAPVPGTRLHELLGDEVVVDSFHHQAVDELGAGLVVSARAPDGVIEAIELPGRFVLAMQCELHEEWRVEPRVQQVVEAFVAAAGERVPV
ncbi:MAG TPA: gamma-glutamyl-gamma-aminobutyrate hydrolase family protein [Gaiellales bacterium]|nr:gamma-glutamyl-gamma-aminobutyrate hydrolase family protein [Gaiellales bacterium]